MRILYFGLAVCILVAKIAFSAEIVLVYPRVENDEKFIYQNKVDSTFILGRVVPPIGNLIANGKEIFYNNSGAFLAYLPLESAGVTNAWKLALINNSDTLASLRFPYQFKNSLFADSARPDSVFATPKYVRVSFKNSNIRTFEAGSYFIFPELGTELTALGESKEFYEVRLTDNQSGYIEKKSVSVINNYVPDQPVISDGICTQVDSEILCSFKVSKQLIWSSALSASNQTLQLTLYDSKSAIERIKYDTHNLFVDDIIWNQTSEGTVLEFRCSEPVYYGYEIACTDDSLMVKIKTSYSDNKRGLLGKMIVLDAGHGGMAKGSVGPMGTMEKDVTLRWARLLKPMLEKHGAIVKLTRTEDVDIGLYDRIDYAKMQNADFFLSLHFNALPDCENPFVRNGSGTYFYQSGSRFAAKILHNHLLKRSKLRDDGLYDASFAVVRPTYFPSVLVEAAYIIYPNEERLINNNEFLTDISEAMIDGLKEYFKLYP